MRDDHFLREIMNRAGEDLVLRRLEKQVGFSEEAFSGRLLSAFSPARFRPIHKLAGVLLKLTGLYKRGMKNTLNYSVESVTIPINDLPEAFNGFRILHLTDLHSDAILDKGKSLIRKLEGFEADLCVFTGDFCNLCSERSHPDYRLVKKIVDCISSKHGVYGVLGNHDYLEFIPELGQAGITILLNSFTDIDIGNESIRLGGIDDAHLYKCHDIQRATGGRGWDRVTVMMSHTPEAFLGAEIAGVDLMLCGHTHGGQICLPGRIPLSVNVDCLREFASGLWYYGNLTGYTSRGIGTSVMPVRFNCPPEITEIVLTRAHQ